MNMVGITTNLNNGAIEFIADATEIAVQLGLHRWLYEGCTMFGAE
jgi:hypothetical protein